jgi:hypothetical protein
VGAWASKDASSLEIIESTLLEYRDDTAGSSTAPLEWTARLNGPREGAKRPASLWCGVMRGGTDIRGERLYGDG